MDAGTDVFVIGGGPAGLAAAIAARRKGFRVTVADGAHPPIDKACGEGLMPDGLAALRDLGVTLAPQDGFALRGVRFVDELSAVETCFPTTDASAESGAGRATVGVGLRRPLLQQRMIERATALGVSFLWDTPVMGLRTGGVAVSARGATNDYANGSAQHPANVSTHRAMDVPPHRTAASVSAPDADDSARRASGAENSGDNLAQERVIPARWIIGADGGASRVRRWSRLDAHSQKASRFAFRCHYRVTPWSPCTQFYWGERGQAYVTPVSANEVCVVIITRALDLRPPGSRNLGLRDPGLHDPDLRDTGLSGSGLHDPGLHDRGLRASLSAASRTHAGSRPFSRMDELLQDFPALLANLAGAEITSSERGAITSMHRLRRVTRGNVALIGDASGGVDAITGEGLCLSFHQATALADALARGDLAEYESAHRRLARRPTRMAHMMLALDKWPALRRRVLRAFSAQPEIFGHMLAMHVGATSPAHIAMTGAKFGWRFLAASAGAAQVAET